MTLIPPFIRNRLAHRPDLLKIIHNISWLSLDKLLRMGVGLFISALIARHLAPAQYGLLNYALALTGLTGTLATLGLHEIVVRDIVRSPQQANIALGSAAVLQIFSGLLSFLLTLACIFQLRPNDVLAQTIVAILGSTMLIKASEIPMYWFEAQVQSKYAVSVQNGVFLVFAAIKAFVILNCGTIIGLAWATLGEALSVAITLLVVMNRHGLALNSLRASTRRAKILLQDSWPLVLASFAVAIYMKIDQIMLGQMASDDAVGIFSVAVRISEIWYFMPIAIVASVFPSILEAKSLDEATYQHRLQKLYDLMVLLSLAVALPMTFLAKPIIVVLLGETYKASGTVLTIHIWASVFVFLGVASGKWFIAENRQILSLQRTSLGALSNVVLNLWLIPRYGVIGATIATVVSCAVAGLIFDLIQKETRGMFFMKARSLNFIEALRRIGK